MRSASVGISSLFLVTLLLPAMGAAQSALNAPEDPLIAARSLLRQGDFRGSVAAFQKIIDGRPSPQAYVGLVQSLLKLDDVKTAEERSREAVGAFAGSASAHAARGDVLFRRGLIPEAQDEYKAALNLDPNCARAWLGMGKIEEARARRSLAKEDVLKARELDPDDGDALYEWAVRQAYPISVEALDKHLSEFHSDPEFEKHEREYLELLKALAGRKVWILDRDVAQAEIKMEPLLFGSAFELRGYGVRVKFNDRASALLLLDTGASGVTITRKFAEKIGARKLSDQVLQGIGKGGASGYQALVDKTSVGDIQFHDCLIHVVPQTIAQVDGLMGTDIFSQFLVTVDFPMRKLRLSRSFPAATSEDSGSSAETFSPAYGFGHLLLLPTKASDKAAGLFVLDSGSNVSSISNELSLSMKQMRPLNVQAFGVGGAANSAFIADDVMLQFAGMRRHGERLITVDLHSISKNMGTEASGQIGFATLEKLRLTIDYRDGLVKFEEKSK